MKGCFPGGNPNAEIVSVFAGKQALLEPSIWLRTVWQIEVAATRSVMYSDK